MGLRILSLALLAFSLNALAEPTAEWKQLLSDLVKKGDYTVSTDFVTFHLQRGTSFDRDKDRTVEYLTLGGTVDEDGQFIPTTVSRVKEKWQQNQDTWQVKQTLMSVSLDGSLQEISRAKLIFRDLFLVKNTPLYSPSPQDPTEVSAWQDDIASWVELAKNTPIRVTDWRAKTIGI